MEKYISEQLFTQMHYHFDRWGPGGTVEERTVLRGQDWKKITVEKFSAYHGVKTASISFVNTDDDGEKVENAKIISVEDKHKLIKDYQKLRKRYVGQKKHATRYPNPKTRKTKIRDIQQGYKTLTQGRYDVFSAQPACNCLHAYSNIDLISFMHAIADRSINSTYLNAASLSSTFNIITTCHILKTHMDLIYNSDRCKSLIYNEKINHACILIQHNLSKIWNHKSCMHSQTQPV